MFLGPDRDVRIVHDGAEAIRLAEQFQPHVALIDLRMPGLGGFDVARKLRTRPSLRDALLIALSGFTSEEDAAQAREAGFDHCLMKPSGFERLDEILDSFASSLARR